MNESEISGGAGGECDLSEQIEKENASDIFHDMEENVIEEGGLVILYANVRGLRQAAAQLRMRAELISPTIIILTETHLDGGPLEAEMLTPG